MTKSKDRSGAVGLLAWDGREVGRTPAVGREGLGKEGRKKESLASKRMTERRTN